MERPDSCIHKTDILVRKSWHPVTECRPRTDGTRPKPISIPAVFWLTVWWTEILGLKHTERYCACVRACNWYAGGVREQRGEADMWAWEKTGDNSTVRSFMICAAHQILLERSNGGRRDGEGMWHVWRRSAYMLVEKPGGQNSLEKET